MCTFKRLIVLAIAVLSTLAVPAQAQDAYFGRNKVQYRDFKFQVLKTEHFDIYYYPEEEQAVRLASRMAERWYTRLSSLLNHELRGRQPLILYASGPHFRQTNAIPGELGEGTGGVTEAYKRRIVLPFAGPLEATDHVLGHELVHAFQYDITNTNVSANSPGALALPLWFIEGMAEYLSIGPVDPHTAMWMREAARREKLPDVDDLDNARYFPYRYGQALWAFIGGRYGDRAVGDMLRSAVGRGGYDQAIEEVLGIKTKELSEHWHAAEFEAYRPIAEVTKVAGAFGKPLITKKQNGGDLNVSPELSPDGSRVMFFSEKDLFSIDLFLADARTGKVIRKITDTATDSHIESLQFLTSAGAWDQTGTRFVFPGISRGEPTLTLVDVDRGRTDREIRIKELDEILNPAWSPDGKLIAFSALAGGFNDLFIYDLNAGSLRRLTDDAYAELDPAWSPDGRQIAFSTDRFTTNLQTLQPGALRLAIIDVAGGAVREAGGFANAKNISPQWTADGRALYFLSDHQGITNIYRATLDGTPARQVTNLVTGVSGITALSPALSAAKGRLVFSAYEDDGYNIYAMDSPEMLMGSAQVKLPRNAGVLPPRRTAEGPIATTLENPIAGLPPSTATLPTAPYTPKLSLDFAGQPMLGVGADPFGTYASGGVSFVFSDILGNHTVATGAQVTSRFDEFGGTLLYLNRAHRWNWGAVIDQTPYVARGFEAGFDVVSGQSVYLEREYRILQVDRSFTGLIAYPFSRAQRVEVTGGVRQIGLKEDVTTRLFSPSTGQQLTEDTETLSSLPNINLGQASAALVYDTSIFGLTSPIRGSRYRLELSQSSGSLTYTGVLGDFRTYLMPVRPFTLAFRGLYYGRFGSSAEDGRLPTLFLGYPGLVRGYDSGSFESSECGVQTDGSCPAFDRLIGSRVGVANAELRFPLWGAFGGDRFYGPIPVEMALFADAGIAWGRNSRPGFAGGDREPVFSAGIAARINVLGFAVAEIDYVRPLDRPGRGWLWQFNLRPGF
ncbi:MAG: BamA/TamA family outer membrane protein [Acidobacteria bacterium]|nr:BamA/TamA family outer membrane protein [Acidobacteriota bacterium]MCA1648722.1 BamA/TamA family outer membrane protein [Acidobacteriota bacterium]